MAKKTDTLMIRILELIALLGEATSDEIKKFSNSPSYAEKLITSMKKDSYIKNYKSENKSTYRLMLKGKKCLMDNLPELFSENFTGQKSMNRVRDDKRREERRKKLADVLFLFHRADVKIFPDEKTLLKNTAVNTRTDTTDFTDEHRLEFYTSMEIKNIVPDYKKGIGSRALGILIAFGKLYIVYSTSDGNMLWRKDIEKEFLTNTKGVLAKRLFGQDNGTYLLVLSDNKRVPSIIMQRKERTGGKIHPSSDIANMIFALKDRNMDATLDLILTGSEIPDKLKSIFESAYIPDKKHIDFDGVLIHRDKDAAGNHITSEDLGSFVFWFDLRKVMDAVFAALENNKKVTICCFDYQREYIEIFMKDLKQSDNSRIEILSDSIEGYMEDNHL